MAAVQRTPTPVDIRSRRAFIESMEEELKRVHEHLDRRQWKQRNGNVSSKRGDLRPDPPLVGSAPSRQWYTLARSNPATKRKATVEKEAEIVGIVRVSSAQDTVVRAASIDSYCSSGTSGSKSPTPEPNDAVIHRVKSPSVPLTSHMQQLSTMFTSSLQSQDGTGGHSQETLSPSAMHHQSNKLHPTEFLYTSSLPLQTTCSTTGSDSAEMGPSFNETPLLVKEMPFGLRLPNTNTIHSDDDDEDDDDDNADTNKEVMPSAFGDLYMEESSSSHSRHRLRDNPDKVLVASQQHQQQLLSHQKQSDSGNELENGRNGPLPDSQPSMLLQHISPSLPPKGTLLNRKEDDDEGLGKSSLTIIETSGKPLMTDDSGSDISYEFQRYQRMQALKESKARSEMLEVIQELKEQLREKENDMLLLQERMHVEVKVREERIKKLMRQNARSEKEKWDLLKKARDAAERSVHVKTKLDLNENQLRSMTVELDRATDELSSVKAANKSLRLMVSDLKGRESLVSTGTQTDSSTPMNEPSMETVSSDAGTQTSRSDTGDGSIHGSTSGGQADTEDWEDMVSITSSTYDSRDLTPINTPKLERGKGRRSMKKLLNRLRRTSSTGKHHSVSNLSKSSITADTTASLENLRLSQSSLSSPVGLSRSSGSVSSSHNRLSAISLQHDTCDPNRILDDFKVLPFNQWNTRALAAWMELVVGMPHYISNVRQHVTSGHAILALSNSDLEKKLNISNPLHRRRLRLCIEEYRSQPPCPSHPYLSEIDHNWVAYTWAVECGLPHISASLYNGMVNGKVLNSLSKDDLKKYLKISKKVEQLSLLSGIELLRMHEFNREAIKSHRQSSNNPLYWTNNDVCEWLQNTDLEAYANNVSSSGVHGALLFLERGNFTSEHLANIIQLPPKSALRRILANQLAKLFSTEEVGSEEVISEGQQDLSSSQQDVPIPHHQPPVVVNLSPPHTSVSPTGDGSPHPLRRRGMVGGMAHTASNPHLIDTNEEEQQQAFTRNNRDRISLRESILRSVNPPPPPQRVTRSHNQRPLSQVCSTTTV